MRWKVHGRRTMYESDWVNVLIDDVELPDGTHIDHHVLTMPKASQTAVVVDATHQHVLLIWRHRFIVDQWGWEVPAGWAERGEDLESAIRREILEETGYGARRLTRLANYFAIPGISTMHFTAWLAEDVVQTRQPEVLETDRAEWHPLQAIASMIRDGKITDGPSITALSIYLSNNEMTTRDSQTREDGN